MRGAIVEVLLVRIALIVVIALLLHALGHLLAASTSHLKSRVAIDALTSLSSPSPPCLEAHEKDCFALLDSSALCLEFALILASTLGISDKYDEMEVTETIMPAACRDFQD